MMKAMRRIWVLPVKRRLAFCSIAYLAGIYLTRIGHMDPSSALVCCAFLLGMVMYRGFRRKSALFCAMIALAVAGNAYAGWRMRICDMPTRPGVHVTGVVDQVINNNRFRLREVSIDGADQLERPVAVTLMFEDDAFADTLTQPVALVGQRVSGTGRLFAQDEVRNPGGVDWRIRALCSGYDLSGYILPGWTVAGETQFSISDMFRRAREAICVRIDALFGEHAPLFRAVMLGEKGEMNEDVAEAMSMSGTAHILAVSGMHVGLLAGAIAILLDLLPIGGKMRFLITAALLVGFTGLTGGAPGTVRAMWMALMRRFASLTGRRYDGLTALAAAALCITIVNPIWALHASFQFSFFVVLGILLLHRQTARLLYRGHATRYIGRISSSLAISFSAQLAALPMQLRFYGYVPLLSLPMNALCGLLLPLILLGGWICVTVSYGSAWFACVMALPIGWIGMCFERLHLAAVESIGGILRLPSPYTVTVLLFGLLLVSMSKELLMKRGRGWMCALLGVLVALSYLPRLNPAARYVQLDVGQGDGAVIRYGRRAVLIDVGPLEEQAAVRYLRNEGLFLDLVILSHLDEDHAGALATILESEIDVCRIAMPTGAMDDAVSQAVLDALLQAEEKGICVETYEYGQRIDTGEIGFDVLSPREGLKGSNERSLVLHGDLWGTTMLSLGDLTTDSEMERIPQSDLLKVAHHGSKYATSKRLIDMADPRVALISVGANAYGHPTQRVLDDLAGVDVYRTDDCGCITVWLSPELRVETYCQ